MIEKLKAIDEELFIWLNSFHANWLDPIVFQMTETVTWIPFYAILIYFIYRALLKVQKKLSVYCAM